MAEFGFFRPPAYSIKEFGPGGIRVETYKVDVMNRTKKAC